MKETLAEQLSHLTGKSLPEKRVLKKRKKIPKSQGGGFGILSVLFIKRVVLNHWRDDYVSHFLFF